MEPQSHKDARERVNYIFNEEVVEIADLEKEFSRPNNSEVDLFWAHQEKMLAATERHLEEVEAQIKALRGDKASIKCIYSNYSNVKRQFDIKKAALESWSNTEKVHARCSHTVLQQSRALYREVEAIKYLQPESCVLNEAQVDQLYQQHWAWIGTMKTRYDELRQILPRGKEIKMPDHLETKAIKAKQDKLSTGGATMTNKERSKLTTQILELKEERDHFQTKYDDELQTTTNLIGIEELIKDRITHTIQWHVYKQKQCQQRIERQRQQTAAMNAFDDAMDLLKVAKFLLEDMALPSIWTRPASTMLAEVNRCKTELGATKEAFDATMANLRYNHTDGLAATLTFEQTSEFNRLTDEVRPLIATKAAALHMYDVTHIPKILKEEQKQERGRTMFLAPTSSNAGSRAASASSMTSIKMEDRSSSNSQAPDPYQVPVCGSSDTRR